MRAKSAAQPMRPQTVQRSTSLARRAAVSSCSASACSGVATPSANDGVHVTLPPAAVPLVARDGARQLDGDRQAQRLLERHATGRRLSGHLLGQRHLPRHLDQGFVGEGAHAAVQADLAGHARRHPRELAVLRQGQVRGADRTVR